jgi:hypothetical protein
MAVGVLARRGHGADVPRWLNAHTCGGWRNEVPALLGRHVREKPSPRRRAGGSQRLAAPVPRRHSYRRHCHLPPRSRQDPDRLGKSGSSRSGGTLR